ncbi:MAG: VTT domain-containing protein [Anditalea sp.]
MSKKQSIFERLKTVHAKSPAMIWAVAWVAIIPSLGSLMALNTLYLNLEVFDQLRFLAIDFLLLYTVITSLLMGLALMPTTLLAIISGFLFGWESFPFLVIAYSLASVIGYWAGKKLDKNSLDLLLRKYPKAAQMITDKRHHISQLIFFVRLSPVIPFALSNLLFALLRIDLIKVIWMGLWGMLPRTLMAFTTGVLAESLLIALQERNGVAQVLTVVALILISGWGIYRFFRKG